MSRVTLDGALEYLVQEHSPQDARETYSNDDCRTLAGSTTHYLEIPIAETGELYEVPTFWNSLWRTIPNSYNTMIVSLRSRHNTTGLQTTETALAHAWNISNAKGLIPIPLKNDPYAYWALPGLLLTKELEPIVIMCNQKHVGNLATLKKILRVSPICFTEQDSLTRLVINKIIKKFVLMEDMYHTFKCEVVIGKIPFRITRVTPPDIYTYNEELLNVAKQRVNEIYYGDR